jgi:hypothetical protein
MHVTGLTAQSARRQPKNKGDLDKKASCMAAIPERIDDANPAARNSG